MDEAVRDAIVGEFKQLQRRVVPEHRWPIVAPLVVSHFGQGSPSTAIDYLKRVVLEDDQKPLVGASLEALGLGSRQGKLETRLDLYGKSLRPVRGYWQMRNWAEDGYRILADHILDPNYATSVQISFDVRTSEDRMAVDVRVAASIVNARQDTYVDVDWSDRAGGEGKAVLVLRQDQEFQGEEVTFRGMSVEPMPQVVAVWPKSLQCRAWADTDGRHGPMKFIRGLETAAVWMLGPPDGTV